MGQSALAGVLGLMSPAGGLPAKQPGPCPERPGGGPASSRGGTPILAGAAPAKDPRGSGLDPLPGRCSPTLPGGLRRPGELCRPPRCRRVPGTSRSFQAAARGRRAAQCCPQWQLAGLHLKGPRRGPGTRVPRWLQVGAVAGREVTGSLQPQGQAWGLTRGPGSRGHLAGPASPHLQDTCPRAAGGLAGLGAEAWRKPKPWPAQQTTPGIQASVQPGQEQMGGSPPCWPLRCSAGGAKPSPGTWVQMGTT